MGLIKYLDKRWIKKYLYVLVGSFMIFLSALIFGVTKPSTEKINVKLDQE